MITMALRIDGRWMKLKPEDPRKRKGKEDLRQEEAGDGR